MISNITAIKFAVTELVVIAHSLLNFCLLDYNVFINICTEFHHVLPVIFRITNFPAIHLLLMLADKCRSVAWQLLLSIYVTEPILSQMFNYCRLLVTNKCQNDQTAELQMKFQSSNQKNSSVQGCGDCGVQIGVTSESTLDHH